jgi:heme exporter protein CcmD
MNIDWDLFWHMGGYGAYVWSGWGLAVLALGTEFLQLRRRSRRLPPPGHTGEPRR